MPRKILSGLIAASVLAAMAVACSTTPQTPVSPTGADASSGALNPDGSNMKVTAPTGLSPTGVVVVDTLRPTLRWNNSTGVFQTTGYTYEVEVQNAQGTVVYSRRLLGETPGGSSHEMQADLTYSDNFWFRVRAHVGDNIGPWSGFSPFRTFDRPAPPTPVPPTPSTGGLPFPIPPQCVNVNPANGFPCAAAIAGLSNEWGFCAAGFGVGCHRFTRQVANAMAASDPAWANIQAAPGGHACNCAVCGPSDGTMYREDTVFYNGGVYDMIVGAGGPTPSLTWSFVGGIRPGDGANLAPLCTP